MRISTQTDIIFPAFGIDEGMKIFKEAGFDALDFSMFYMNSSFESVLGNMSEDELVGKLLESSEKYSLPFNQAHAPFPSYRFGNEEYNKFVYEKLKLSIRIAGKIGASQIIVHPTACPDGVDQKQFNIDFYNSLKPLCEEFGIKIALENMFGHDMSCSQMCAATANSSPNTMTRSTRDISRSASTSATADLSATTRRTR